MTPWLDDGDVRLYLGDNLDVLRSLPDRSVHMCATSPPFYGLRSYIADGHADKPLEIGLEATPDEWVARLVAVFREVRRVLRDDGTLWVEIGDSYGSGGVGGKNYVDGGKNYAGAELTRLDINAGLKPKDLLGQPWLLAFALRADGWYLRSEIIWARPNPMPESVTDRPTKSHSTVFLLSKQPRYFYDADAIREPGGPTTWGPNTHGGSKAHAQRDRDGGGFGVKPSWSTEVLPSANARSVWTVPTQPTPFAHFATWPEALVRRMILAGTSEHGCCPECGAPWVRDVESRPMSEVTITSNGPKRQGREEQGLQSAKSGLSPSRVKGTPVGPERTLLGWSPSCACKPPGSDGLDKPGEWEFTYPPVPCTVLDPFAGSATTMLVARNHGRHSIGIELNADYLQIAAKRLQQLSLLNT